MSRELPILFNMEMVRAILDGRKSCTRRLVKTRRKDAYGFCVARNTNGAITGIYEYDEDERMFDNPLKPPYQPGDILYVRETFIQAAAHIFWYKADDKPWMSQGLLWKPSIHMPKEAARIWLKVTDVRVERLQEITNDEAVKEGIYVSNCKDCNAPFGCDSCPDEGYDEIDEFAELWDSTVKKSDLDRYGWNANPWVWVIEFERCEKPKGEN